jgi:CBS domain-containing protein
MGEKQVLKVKDIMSKNVITVTAATPVSEVIDLVLEKRINGVPVIDANGRLCGILTITNLFRMLDSLLFDDPLNNYRRDITMAVDEIMTKDIHSIGPEMTVKEVVHLSLYKDIHTFPVIEDSTLIGIIGKRDILKAGYSLVQEMG